MANEKTDAQIQAEAEASRKDFFQKLLKVQQEFVATKSEKNAFGNYSYRNIEKMLSSLKPILKKYELYVSFQDEVVQVGDRYYVKSRVDLTDGPNAISSFALAREADEKKGMDLAQITGAASTYAHKYALSALLGVDDGTQDPDSKDNSQPDYTPHNRLVRVAEVTELLRVAKEASGLSTREDVEKWFEEVIGMKITQVKQIEFEAVKQAVMDNFTTSTNPIRED